MDAGCMSMHCLLTNHKWTHSVDLETRSKMETLQVFALLLSCVFLFYMFRGTRRGPRHPPGPTPLPLIGNMIELHLADRAYPFKALAILARKYGNVLGVRVGSVDMVALHGYTVIKAALSETDDLLDRIDNHMFLNRSFGKPQGLISSRGQFWKLTRRFAVTHLREFGFGKQNAMQRFVHEELDVITSYFDTAIENNKGLLSPNTLFHLSSANLALILSAGIRFSKDDVMMKEIFRLNAEFVKNIRVSGGILVAFPWLKSVLPWLFNNEKLNKLNQEMQCLLKNLILSVKDKGTYRTNPQSFVEVFLQKMELPDGSSEDSLILTEENLITILYDFFTAAGDTTAGTMAYALLWLVLHPHVQQKCYQEIVSVIGTDRLPRLTDKANLPYVRATILEVHRRSTIAPLLPHKVFKDTEFQGFLIPKNTNVLINVYSSQMDPDTWDDPESFNPERFLDSEGDIINEHKLLTFSIGKRDCPGKAVAEMAIFSFLTGIIQKYKLLPVAEDYKYETRPVFGGGLSPPAFTVRIEQRPAVPFAQEFTSNTNTIHNVKLC